MAHEMTHTDKAIAQGGAWHGLSENAPNLFDVRDAAKKVWSWEAEISGPLSFTFPDGRETVTDARCIRRTDNGDCIGVCGTDTVLFSMRDLETMADTLSGIVGWKCSSMGTLQGGRKVYATLAATTEEDIGKSDIVRPYLTILSGFDGTTPLSVWRAALRTVCMNTFRATLSGGGNLLKGRHTKGLSVKVADLIAAIRRGDAEWDAGKTKIVALQRAQVNRETIRNFWADIVMREYGEFKADPENGHDERRNARIGEFLAFAADTFDVESAKFGANLWVAANAATKALQHHRSNDIRTDSGRIESLAFGKIEERTAQVFADALALV